MKNISNTLLATSLMFMLVLGIVTGWMSHKSTVHCPEVQSDTVYVYDTIIRTIPKTVYKFRYLSVPEVILDTVVLRDTMPVDTATILKDYFAKVEFLRQFEDSNLKLTLTDTVTQNKIVGGGIQYQLLKPQTVAITQPVIPDKGHLYVTQSVDIPVKHAEGYWANYGGTINLLYTRDYWIGGVGYTLSDIPSVRVQFGVRIF